MNEQQTKEQYPYRCDTPVVVDGIEFNVPRKVADEIKRLSLHVQQLEDELDDAYDHMESLCMSAKP